jgi:hypothetical protein
VHQPLLLAAGLYLLFLFSPNPENQTKVNVWRNAFHFDGLWLATLI